MFGPDGWERLGLFRDPRWRWCCLCWGFLVQVALAGLNFRLSNANMDFTSMHNDLHVPAHAGPTHLKLQRLAVFCCIATGWQHVRIGKDDPGGFPLNTALSIAARSHRVDKHRADCPPDKPDWPGRGCRSSSLPEGMVTGSAQRLQDVTLAGVVVHVRGEGGVDPAACQKVWSQEVLNGFRM